jgi:phosphotriesterase-related protein
MPTFVELVARGYTDRILLGCDAVANLDWFPPELLAQLLPKWTHTHLFDEILPAAREQGVSDEQIAVMLDENPKAWLTA